jgi:cysteine desulfurase family protein
MIYFDNAATSFPKPPEVARAVTHAIDTYSAPNRGAYPLAAEASRALYTCRETTADFFNCKNAASVVFTSGATESLNTAIYGLLTTDDHVITTMAEHNAVLRPLYRLGCALDILPCDARGDVLWEDMHKHLKKTTKAVVCSNMSNVTGSVADIAFISRFCRENGLWLIVDSAQSAGCVPVNSSLADVVCFTGHKGLFGPQGTGGMIVNDAPVKPLKVGGTGHHAQEREQPDALPDRLEAGILNGHGLAGLTAGLRFINIVTLEAILEKKRSLTKYFMDGLTDMKKITRYGGNGIVSLAVSGYGSEEVSDILANEYNIASRPGLHCAPLLHKALGTDRIGLTRFSFSFFNTQVEIETALNALEAF